jgi:hypothetical protein
MSNYLRVGSNQIIEQMLNSNLTRGNKKINQTQIELIKTKPNLTEFRSRTFLTTLNHIYGKQIINHSHCKQINN